MQYAICRGSVLPDGLGLNQCLLIGKPPPPIPDQLLCDVLPGWVWGFFTFCELESLRLSPRRSIRFGIREARKRNCGSKQCCCCHQLCPHSFRGLLGGPPPPGKGDTISQNAFSGPYLYPERGIWPNMKKGGRPHLPNIQIDSTEALYSGFQQCINLRHG